MLAILDAVAEGRLAAKVAAVISNEPQAKGLVSACERGIATRVVAHREFASRELFDRQLAQTLDEFKPDLVLLAGFMRVLTPAFVNAWRGRLINIHPSLLPAYPGLHTHRRALQERAKVHGATVHFVTEQLDGGPSIVQAAVPVFESDSEESLAARVLQQEHVIYPQAVAWLLAGKVKLGADDRVQHAQ